MMEATRAADQTARRLRAELTEVGRRRAEAELRALKAELNTRFLAHALGAMRSLIRTDVTAADRVLVRLGDLVRAAVVRVAPPEVTVDEDLAWLQPLLEVECARLEGRLFVQSSIAPDAHDGLVPNLLFQTLVEHAVRHALAYSVQGHVRLAVRRQGADGAQLEITVVARGAAFVGNDVGIGSAHVIPKPVDDDVGLSNLRARLGKLYGEAATIEVTIADGCMVAARATIPWHDEPVNQHVVPGHDFVDDLAPENADQSLSRLRTELERTRHGRVEAELRALKAEINPHFVGNALSVISGLMRSDPADAERVLSHLRDLLTAVVARAGTQEVTLREELATLEPFLAVERARLGRELEVAWNVDAGTLSARVPHMILQPLVENAVKHGLGPRGKAGRIEVAARRDDRVLELTVYDDGVGFGDPARRRGVGLSNARARLSELYGDRASLELSPALDGGTIARVRIPWRAAVEEHERDLDQFGLQPLMPQEVHELEVVLPCDME